MSWITLTCTGIAQTIPNGLWSMAIVILLGVPSCAFRREISMPGKTASEQHQAAIYNVPEGYELGSFIYCDANKAFCCVIRRPDHGTANLVYNGAVIAEGHAFRNIAFSRNGKRFVYAMRDQNRRWTVVDNGVKQGPYDEVYHWTMTDDGLHYAYEVIDGNPRRYCVIRDGERVGMEFHGASSPAYSPDGLQFAYVAILENNRSFIMLNDRALEPRDNVNDPIFSQDGHQVAYTAYDLDECYLQLHGGLKIGPYFMIEESRISQDGRQYAFVAKKKIPESDAMLLPMNKRVSFHAIAKEYESPAYEIVASPALSVDAKHTLFRVFHKDKWRILLNGSIMPSAEEDIWHAVFVPPDNQVAYSIERDKKWRVVCDNRESATFDAIHSLQSTPAGDVYFIASRGRTVTRERLQ